MRIETMVHRGDEVRLVSTEGDDYGAAKLALQPLIDDEQVLSYRRLDD